MRQKTKSIKLSLKDAIEASNRTTEALGVDKTKFAEENHRALKNYLSDNPLPFDCNHHYQPKPQQWIFHNLCDTCFALFDKQKVYGRIDLFINKRQTAYFEDSDAWSKAVKTRSS